MSQTHLSTRSVTQHYATRPILLSSPEPSRPYLSRLERKNPPNSSEGTKVKLTCHAHYCSPPQSRLEYSRAMPSAESIRIAVYSAKGKEMLTTSSRHIPTKRDLIQANVTRLLLLAARETSRTYWCTLQRKNPPTTSVWHKSPKYPILTPPRVTRTNVA
ncbi:hypothetical protein WN48_10164 [Eufriesea mexicana]|uniref:Ig-like domain-containing protein n=1 Tax=Eufriesea mexicana TaxID=516756 RepID=A0A310SBW1_9HYME|nr:hypothetical protein WN48_10164 [Eufriesea mexicana]